MKKLESINWGIIGVGDVTEVKSGPAFYKVEHSTVAAVMRRDAAKAADYAQRHGIAKWYSDADDLINDPDVNAVYVATPPNSHAEYAIAAMQAGKPVYVEKPMARTYTECEKMLRVSRETGLPLWVAYYRRALPAFLEAKWLVETGEIGQPLSVRVTLQWPARERRLPREEMNWRVKPDISGAGHFYDLASHQFDYLDFVLGEITEVSGIAANLAGMYAAEDTVAASWQHASGVIGSGSWSFTADAGPEQDSIEITGDKGALVLSSFERPDILVRKTNTSSREETFENPENISHNLVQQVVNELRGEGSCVSTGESAARTNRVMEEIIRNYYSYKA